MDFTSTKMTARLVLESGWVPLIVGESGIGKTALVRELAAEMNAACVSVDANLLKEGEIGGLPTVETFFSKAMDKEERRTVYAVHTKLTEVEAIINEGKNDKVLLFIDELNRCEHAVQQELMNIILNREINGYRLDERVLVIAAMNPSNKYLEYRQTDYRVVDMDPAQEDRFVWLFMDSDIQSWLEWGAASGIHPDILAFVATFPNLLHTPRAKETIKATPRSWERVSDAYSLYEKNRDLYKPTVFFNVLKGNLGSMIAQDFFGFLENNQNPLISPDDVFGASLISDALAERISGESHSRLFISSQNCLGRLEEMLEDNVIEGELERFTDFLSICPLDLRMSVMQRIKADHGESLYPLFVKIEAFLEAYYEGVRSVY
jgi:nucleoside-triphosphatase THEP1